VKTREVVPEVFSRHATAYRDRLKDVMDRGEARGRLLIPELLAVREGERVLDLGCGPGTLTYLLGEAAGADGLVVGVDLAPGMLELASSRRSPTVLFMRMDIERLGFRDRSFDAVACGHALQFCPDLVAALAGVRRVLRPAGRFAASVPHDPPERRGLLDHAIEGLLPPPPDLPDTSATREVLGDEARFKAVLLSVGFRTVTVERVNEVSRYGSPAELMSRTMSWWALAWRLESLSEAELKRFHRQALQRLRERTGDGPLEIAGASLVAYGQ
jgi:SAM-dependent methyltransferase